MHSLTEEEKIAIDQEIADKGVQQYLMELSDRLLDVSASLKAYIIDPSRNTAEVLIRERAVEGRKIIQKIKFLFDVDN